MLKVVLDTNIYVSAILVGGKPEQIIDLAREGVIEVFISKPILVEIERILKEKLRHTDEQVQFELLDTKSVTKFISPKAKVAVVQGDEADNRILECAIHGKVDYLISGDTKHLQPLKQYKGVKILSPAEFLEKLLQE